MKLEEKQFKFGFRRDVGLFMLYCQFKLLLGGNRRRPAALYFWRHVGLFDPAQNILFVTPGATTAPT